MSAEMLSPETLGIIAKQWWEGQPATVRRASGLGAGAMAMLWLAGALHAPSAVFGVARLEGIARLLMAVCMGGFSFLWQGLKAAGLIEETLQQPHLLWLPLAALAPGTVGLAVYLLSQPLQPHARLQRTMARMARLQGRMTAGEVVAALGIEKGVPLALVAADGATRTVGLDYLRAEGHVMVVAPTRAGKGLQLTDALLHYPGAALVIDPKGEQMARTAALRSKLGPVCRIPGHQVHLSAYYRHLRDRDEVIELHYHLLKPWASRESIFAEKALSLFTAVGLFAEATGRNPLRLLLDLAESHPVQALTALRTVAAARRHVDIFTNGALPAAYHEDKFVTSALGNFTTRLAPYQQHIDTIAPPDLGRRDLIIDPDWVAQRGTVYVTYGLHELRAASGVVAALVAAMLRYQIRKGNGVAPPDNERLLVAVDELPAVGLRNVIDYLAICGGYGMTLMLYAQSVAQLEELYGRAGTRAILSNCDHQIWYPAAEIETARFMSELYGTTLKAAPAQSRSHGARRQEARDGTARVQTDSNESASWSWREGAVLSPNEVMALPKGQVLVTTLAERRYTFLGQRLNSIHLFDRLPAADGLNLPQPATRPREYVDWQALVAQQAAQAQATAAPSRADEATVRATRLMG